MYLQGTGTSGLTRFPPCPHPLISNIQFSFFVTPHTCMDGRSHCLLWFEYKMSPTGCIECLIPSWWTYFGRFWKLLEEVVSEAVPLKDYS
jgi:hypothetical protein